MDIRLFETLKMFYPPKGAAKAVSKVGQLLLRVFYSPKGLCMQIPMEVQLVLAMTYCVRKRILDIQFTGGNSPFLNLENVLL